eukprot:gene11907-8189_t
MSAATTTTTTTTGPSPVSEAGVAAFAEAFTFLTHDREDVRKMAIHGIAAQSRDNADLCAYLVSTAGHHSVEVLLQHLHLGAATLLGDILTVLINTSVDAGCAEVMVQKKVIRKAMRLLDSFHNPLVVLPSATLSRSLQELTLMLLSNLTSTYIVAVDEFLQREDEDMRGFYLGKLQSLHDRSLAEAEAEGEEEAGGKKGDAKEAAAAAAEDSRDLRRWMLQIVLNLTRCVDGQEQVLEDEGWQKILCNCLADPVASHRFLAAQTFRNCATSSSPSFALLIKGGGVLRAVRRLSAAVDTEMETSAEIQQCLAEFLAGVLESEEGVGQLESINAKKLLSSAVNRSNEFHWALENEPRVRELKDGEAMEEVVAASEPQPPTVLLHRSVAEFVEKHILPHLDDIIDAYLAPGSEALD